MTPTQQTAHDLRLNLVEGPIGEWSPFNILKMRGRVMGPWDIKAHVIGASHLISVNYKGVCFHEIVACMEVKAAARRIYYGPIPEAGDLAHRFLGQVEYRFDAKILPWDAGEPVMANLEQAAEGDAGRQFGMTVDFPPVDTETIPKTILLVAMEDRSLRFETVHSYPYEDCIVLTETSIKETL